MGTDHWMLNASDCFSYSFWAETTEQNFSDMRSLLFKRDSYASRVLAIVWASVYPCV